MLNDIKNYLITLGRIMLEARQESANRQIARMQLFQMTDRELNDIGITRGDIKRVTRD